MEGNNKWKLEKLYSDSNTVMLLLLLLACQTTICTGHMGVGLLVMTF